MSEKHMLRRVQLTGGSTLIVSLPKEWVKSVHLKPGDYVVVMVQPDNSLKIIPARKRKELHESVLCIDESTSPSMAVREFITRYLVGYDVIKVVFKGKTHEHRVALRNVMVKKMIGVEIVEETVDIVLFQCLAKPAELPIRTAINRMIKVSHYMLKDALKCMRNPEKTLLKEIIERDDTIDKFYLFIVRQLKSVAMGMLLPSEVGLTDLRECLGFRLIAKSIERIGDHASRIAEVLYKSHKPVGEKIASDIEKLGGSVCRVYEKTSQALSKYNKVLAHQVVDEVSSLRQVEDTIIRELMEKRVDVEEALVARTIVESLKRIAEYCADIAEITVNLSVEGALEKTTSS
ncbi:MAG: hypothetical protein DRJ52_04565 [Thermoprotei archaeon]|nr:MAG: hypothetical protein DRJ52_04565 [Thermoprotei archaeon]